MKGAKPKVDLDFSQTKNVCISMNLPGSEQILIGCVVCFLLNHIKQEILRNGNHS